MNQIIYPDKLYFNGPFLINIESLLELDNIIEDGWQNYQNINEETFKNIIDEKCKSFPNHTREKIEQEIYNSYYYNKKKKELQIIFKSGNKLECNSFKEASIEPSVKNEIPIGFNYIIKTSDNNTNISLSDYDRGSINISVSPNNSINNEILFKLTRWVEANQSNKWIQIWTRYYFVMYLIFFIYYGFSTVFITTKTDVFKETLKKQATEVLKNGIDSTEINRSLELLLYNNYNVVPTSFNNKDINNIMWFWIAVILGIITFVLSYPPHNYIGIGKGIKKIKHWKTWIKIISYYIPISLILPIVLNKLSNIF